MPAQLTGADADVVAGVISRRLGADVVKRMSVEVGVNPDLPGELEVLAAAAAAVSIAAALTDAGYPNRVRDMPAGRANCLCCAAQRFAGRPWMGRCGQCAHFFERHVVERMLRVLPALPAPDSRISIVVSGKHDLVGPAGAGR